MKTNGILLSVAAMALHTAAWATPSHWTGNAGDGNWSTAANWDIYPSNTNEWVIDGSYTINDSITVLDPGSVTLKNGASLNGQIQRIGWGGGNGILNVESGSVYSHTLPFIFLIGDASEGFVNVSGTGSQLVFTAIVNQLDIGFNGSGTLTLSDGGSIHTQTGQIIKIGAVSGHTGTLNIGTGNDAGGTISSGAIITDFGNSGHGYLNFNHANNSYTFTNTIQNSGYGTGLSLTHNGSGTTTMVASADYKGSTQINNGTLAIDSSAISAGDSLLKNTNGIVISGNGTLKLSGTGNNTRIQDSIGIVMNGGSIEVNGVKESLGEVTVNSDSSLKISGAKGSSVLIIDALNLNGTLDIQGWQGNYMTDEGAFDSESADRIYITNLPIDLVDFAGKITWSDFNISGYEVKTTDFFMGLEGIYIVPWLALTPVPEPSSFAMLLGAATLGFVACRRRRK